jgi:hypothetical protein
MQGFTDEQLEAAIGELQRRRAEPDPPPEPLEAPVFDGLVAAVKTAVSEAVANGYMDKNAEGYVWEAAIEAVFGPKYWEWRRRQKW